MPNDVAEKMYPINPRKAREQAAAALGFLASCRFELDNGETWELPLRDFADLDMRKRLRAHDRYMKSMDKEQVSNPVTGKESERFITPYQKHGQDVDEAELLCVALMGEGVELIEHDGCQLPLDYVQYLEEGTLPPLYERFLRAGGVPGQIAIQWMDMSRQISDRAKYDSKSR